MERGETFIHSIVQVELEWAITDLFYINGLSISSSFGWMFVCLHVFRESKEKLLWKFNNWVEIDNRWLNNLFFKYMYFPEII